MSTTDQAAMSTPALSPRAEAAFRAVTMLSVTILAVLAAILSYDGLRKLALDADISPNLAWIFPIVIDGLTFVGSIGVVYSVLARINAWYPWSLTLLGVGISVTGNVAVSPDDPISRMVHAAPPIVLALSLEALLRVYRARAHIMLTEKDKKKGRRRRNDRVVSAAATPVVSSAVPDLAMALHRRDPVTVSVEQGSADGSAAPARVKVQAMLVTEPGITGAEVSRRLGIDDSHARKVLRELRDEAASAQSPLPDEGAPLETAQPHPQPEPHPASQYA